MTKKKFMTIEIIITIVFITIISYASYKEYTVYKEITNQKIAMLIANIKDKYPNISDEEIISTINNNNQNGNILAKYGYTKDDAYLTSMTKSYYESLGASLLIIIIFITLQIYVYKKYEIEQEKRIKEIDGYLKDINNKKYHLMIEDNNEDELSKLHNELYKTTIMLKESAEKNATEKIELSNALADISHQLKTPLTSLRILLDNISENPDMDVKTRTEFLNNMSKQVDWMSSLIISLLKIARLDAGAVKMIDKDISINDLLKEIEDNLSIILDIKDIKINTTISKNVHANLDYSWNKEALTNIVKNAIEHSKEKSNIDINVTNTPLFLKIEIKDYGEGISKEDKKHIFERFYKAKNSNKNSIGIGLALSKSIIEQENGYITVDSVKGKGTKFTIKYIK